MNEPPIEYADANRPREAARSLAAAWGIPELRALDLLRNPEEYVAECRSRETFYIQNEDELIRAARATISPQEKLRAMERRFAAPWLRQ